MTIDLSRLPTGELGWLALITYVLGTDDRAERYFLEVKSQVDLSTKKDQAKVAKFILGAANRDPDLAARRFGGHALMVLGVGDQAVVGVPAFEAKDLALTIQRLIGADGPRWDFERVLVDDKDVIVIVADPPTGDVATCRADGEGLTDGSIYVRADGETRRATGDEVRALIEWARKQSQPVEVDVAIEGEVLAVQVDESVLTEWIQQEADRYRSSVDAAPRNPYALAGLAAAGDTRSREEFLAEVAAWASDALADPTAGVVALAGRMSPTGIRVHLTNRTRTFLRAVRLDIEHEGDLIATEWIGHDRDDPIEVFPDTPIKWGQRTISHFLKRSDFSSIRTSANPHGVVTIRSEKPAYLTMHMDSLRPEERHVSDDDEVVLAMLTDAPPESVILRWRVTAQDIHDVFEGTCEVPVRALDWRGAIWSILGGDEAAEQDEA